MTTDNSVRDIINGTSGDDLISGEALESNQIAGRNGNDTLIGGEADDSLFGSNGDDSLDGGGGDDSLFGAADNDIIRAGSGNDLGGGGRGSDSIFGSDGNDTLSGAGQSDILSGGAGADIFNYVDNIFDGQDVSAPGRQIIPDEDFITDFNFAEDTYRFNATNFDINGDVNFAAVDANAEDASIAPGTNVVVVLNSNDADDPNAPFAAGTAANQIAELTSEDGAGLFVYFNSGLQLNRLVYSTNLNDANADLKIISRQTDLIGQDAIDALNNFSADNFEFEDIPLDGVEGAIQLIGTEGNDSIFGNFENHLIDGLAGDDTLRSSAGNDTLKGGEGSDTLIGGFDDDLLIGGNGDDSLNGSFDNDTLEGGDGNDILNDTIGDNTFFGNAGSDTITGGAGEDVFAYGGNPFEGQDVSAPERQIISDDEDFITDFNFANDTYRLNAADFDITGDVNFVGLDANAEDALIAPGTNIVALLNSDNDGNPDTPFQAGNAADQIAGLTSEDGAGFFIYSNSGLEVNRLVYSSNLNDADADLKIISRQTDLTGADAIAALDDFSADNFEFETM